MTTITWQDKKSGKREIEIVRSKDKLELILQNLVYDGNKREFSKETKVGKEKKIQTVVGFSYESDAEKTMFRIYGLLPKREDYPDDGGDY